MSGWIYSYHDTFNIDQSVYFVPFEFGGYENTDIVTIAAEAGFPTVQKPIRNLNKGTSYWQIQPAIDAADPCNVIQVDPGTYTEALDLGSKSLTIKSTNPEDRSVVENTVVDGGTADNGAIYLSGNAGSTIDGFTLRSSYDGIRCEGSTLTVRNCITDASTGLYVFSSSNITVKACEITAYGGPGINVSYSDANVVDCIITGPTGIQTSGSHPLTVRNCRFQNCRDFGISTSVPLKAYNNTIYGSWMGINLGNPPAGSTSQIFDNLVYQNSYGIHVYNGYNATIQLRNNTSVANTTYGILLEGYNDPISISNTIAWGNGTQISPSNKSNVSYCDVQGGYSGSTNKAYDPCFVNISTPDYHLKPASWIRGIGNTAGIPLTEKDIDDDSRVTKIPGDGNSVCIGADEYKLTDFVNLKALASAWLAHPGDTDWNPVFNFVSDANEIINFKDLAQFASHWGTPTGWINIYAGIGMCMFEDIEQYPQQSELESFQLETSTEQQETSNEYISDYNFPAIYLTCDNNSPDPNTEVTVYVHSDEPLLDLVLWGQVIGDATLTGAMSTADCNQYGWDPGWQMDSYFDSDGWVSVGGVKWAADVNGTVGYFKFIYRGGQVSVSILNEWSQAYVWDEQGVHAVPFSQEALLVGRDPNE